MLSQIVKGSGIVFFGFIAYSLLFLGSNIIIARLWGQTNFGIFSLAFSIFSIVAAISCFGLDRGVTRNIAFQKGRKNHEQIIRLISSSLSITFIISIITSGCLYFLSDSIALYVFQTPQLSIALRIFSIALPFFNVLTVLLSIFRGFQNVKPFVLFQQIALSLLFFLFLIPPFFINFSVNSIFYAYVFAIIGSLLLLLIYLKIFSQIRLPRISDFHLMTAKNLMFFSLPLVGTTLLQRIIQWTDTIMIGGLQTAAIVGLYNAARPLSLFLTAPLSAILLMFTPMVSSMYGAKRNDDMRRSFITITRWLCILTIPLFLFFILFPDTLLGLFFGSSFIPAALTLQILSIGAILQNLTGPNGAYLLALGKSKIIFYASLATAIINIGLNVWLIPLYGIEGAAVASSISIVSVNAIKCFYLYRIHRVHPVHRNIVLPSIISIGISVLTIYIIQIYLPPSLLLLPVFLLLFYVYIILSLFMIKGLQREDIQIVSVIADKVNLNSSKISIFLNRFVK